MINQNIDYTNNNNDDHVLNSISQNGKWISRVFSKELEVKAEK